MQLSYHSSTFWHYRCHTVDIPGIWQGRIGTSEIQGFAAAQIGHHCGCEVMLLWHRMTCCCGAKLDAVGWGGAGGVVKSMLLWCHL